MGDGAATGRGVLTHDLGLPGFLARSLSDRTGRATDVDIVVDDVMTVQDCLTVLPDTDLTKYDVVLFSIGANEALDLMSAAEWEGALEQLIQMALTKAPAQTRVFVLAIPEFSVNPHLPRALGVALDFHVKILNRITERDTSRQQHTVFVPESRDQAFELEDAHHYRRWAARIAERISDNLDPTRAQAASTAIADEKKRLDSVDQADELLYAHLPDSVLDKLADDARRIFHTPMAAVTFVDSDTMHLRARSGLDDHESLPRPEAFCHITIRRNATLVIEDALLDDRYAQLPSVTGDPFVRFYAGYPIEAPSGQNIGAICVMDTKPRSFTSEESAALRELAYRAQKRIFQRATASTDQLQTNTAP